MKHALVEPGGLLGHTAALEQCFWTRVKHLAQSEPATAAPLTLQGAVSLCCHLSSVRLQAVLIERVACRTCRSLALIMGSIRFRAQKGWPERCRRDASSRGSCQTSQDGPTSQAGSESSGSTCQDAPRALLQGQSPPQPPVLEGQAVVKLPGPVLGARSGPETAPSCSHPRQPGVLPLKLRGRVPRKDGRDRAQDWIALLGPIPPAALGVCLVHGARIAVSALTVP